MTDKKWKEKEKSQRNGQKQNREKTRVFGYGGSFTYYMEKIFDLISLSVLWLVCSLPVITIGASTTAAYYTMNKAWKDEDSYVVSEFLRSFRTNLKPATMLWLILAVVSFVLQLNMGIIGAKMSGNIQIFFLLFYGIALFLWTGVQMYAFPALSRFDMPVGWILKLSLYLCFRHIGRTILLVGITALAAGAVYFCWPMVLLTPAIAHYGYHSLLEPVLKEHMPQETAEQK